MRHLRNHRSFERYRYNALYCVTHIMVHKNKENMASLTLQKIYNPAIG